MELVSIVIALSLLEYVAFMMLVGKARGLYGVAAPAVSGDPVFERYYRVQQNTLEVLIIFIPSMVLFAHYVRADAAAGLGVFFLVGRALYSRAYVADPSSRGLGFALSFFPTLILLVGGLVGAAVQGFGTPG